MVGEMSDGGSAAMTGGDQSPQPASGPMDEATARWYVQHTAGQFEAFERDGVWFLCTPDRARPQGPAVSGVTDE